MDKWRSVVFYLPPFQRQVSTNTLCDRKLVPYRNTQRVSISKRNHPPRSVVDRRRVVSVARRCPTLPGALAPSTIGAGGLNFRVRDGNGWVPSAIITRPYIIQGCTLKTGCGMRTCHQSKRLRRSPRPIRIRQLNVLPRLHLGPIYLVIYKGSYLV